MRTPPTTTRRKRPRATTEFRERLAAMRWKLVRDVATTDEELASLDAQQRAEFSEVAVTGATGELMARLEDHERQELDEIIAAQRRLAAGAFGACEDCHGSIPLARLRALPTARRCAACQGRAEAAAR
jgi:RNA polymerase-binding protein DksA